MMWSQLNDKKFSLNAILQCGHLMTKSGGMIMNTLLKCFNMSSFKNPWASEYINFL